MLILKIRRAEIALAGGRLDEAFEIARSSEVREHRRGQELIDRLVPALCARGTEHLAASRYPEAAADCEKAASLGGHLSQVASLRSEIQAALLANHGSRKSHEDVLEAARRHLREGRLNQGKAAIAQLPAESVRVQAVGREIALRGAASAAAAARAREALDRGDWGSALDLVVGQQCDSQESDRLAGEIRAAGLRQLDEAFAGGRLDVAELILPKLKCLPGPNLEIQEADALVRQSRLAFSFIQAGEARRAASILSRLSAVRPNAAWLKDACRQATTAAESLEHLAAGPLGLLGTAAGSSTFLLPPEERPRVPATPEPARISPGPALPERFLLQVDGAPSTLVFRNRCVTIGPLSSSRRTDLGLMADAGLPTISIERIEDDYFLSSASPVAVNDAPVTRRLLVHGDRIALSPRCRLEFRLPSSASTSAVITLAGTRLPQCDARQVVLLDRTLVIGPGQGSHVRVDQIPSQAILHVRQDQLCCRTDQELAAEGRPLDPRAGLPLGRPVRIGPLSLTLQSLA